MLARQGMRPLGIAQAFAFVRQDATPLSELPQAPPLPHVQPPPRVLAPPKAYVRQPPPVVTKEKGAAKTHDEASAALLGQIAMLANEGKSSEAWAACEHYLQRYAPHAQVFYWLGLLSDVAGNAPEAQGFYRKALYLQPQHPEALAHLAVLLASKGDMAGARRLQERAARSERNAERERKQ
ncbi:putative biofilm formation methyltransferase WspC [compost metagenome]